jgi:hypothetical protein
MTWPPFAKTGVSHARLPSRHTDKTIFPLEWAKLQSAANGFQHVESKLNGTLPLNPCVNLAHDIVVSQTLQMLKS